jgi:hypothetical protein
VSAPWDFDQSVEASQSARAEQERVEGEVKAAYREAAIKDRVYNVALARRMWELKRQGIAVTVCERLAKGDPTIASLREDRDTAEGLKETSKIASWRANADRRDTEALIDWSKRRELAEGRA